MLIKISESKISYLKSKDEKELDLVSRLERKILSLSAPIRVTGNAKTNEIIKNKLKQEKIVTQLQYKGIDKPEKLSVLRFFTILFEEEKVKNKKK